MPGLVPGIFFSHSKQNKGTADRLRFIGARVTFTDIVSSALSRRTQAPRNGYLRETTVEGASRTQ